MEQEIIMGNVKIAEFNGFKVMYKDGQTPIVVLNNGDIKYNIEHWAKYHSDWNWQIKTWSKMKDIVFSPPHHIFPGLLKIYQECWESASHCMSIDYPVGAFKYLVKIVDWYNNHVTNKK